MKKRTIHSYILAAGLITMPLAFSACENVLNESDQMRLSDEAALVSLDATERVLLGAYDRHQGMPGNLVIISETFCDNVEYEGADFGLLEIRSLNPSIFTPNGRGLWQDGYRVINSANNVLSAIDRFAVAPNVARANTIKGEALFLRALAHFELVRFYAHQWGYTADNSHLGIPVVTEPTRGVPNPPRATVAKVYEQIIKDLNDAVALLPATNTIRATSWAAKALLARVYFQKNDFANAHAQADEVIKSGRFTLAATGLPTLFVVQPLGSEFIFQSINRQDDNTAGGLLGSFRKGRFGVPPFSASAAFLAGAETGDVRATAWWKRDNTTGKTFVGKYDTDPNTKPDINIGVLRLAEMFLTRAECAAELGRPDSEVRDDVNRIRQRVGLTPNTTAAGKDALLQLIRTERRRELAFEGDRFHYLKRTFATNFRNGISNSDQPAWNDNRLLLKIPDVEMNGNPNMVQNP